MIYSCFDQHRGLYKYFEDGRPLAVNADLPVPSYPSPTKAGVPSLEAARPMPAQAKAAGEGWHAKGIVVRCPNGSISGVVDRSGFFELRLSATLLTSAVLGAVCGVWLMHTLGDRTPEGRRTGIGTGAMLGIMVFSLPLGQYVFYR